MKSMHHRVRNFAIAGAILASALSGLIGALMANGYMNLGGFEIVLSPGMILAWLFTKGDRFTSEQDQALYAIPFSLVINIVLGVVMGALVGMLMSTNAKHQADRLT